MNDYIWLRLIVIAHLLISPRVKFEFWKKLKNFNIFLGNDNVPNLLIKAGAKVNAMAKNSWTPIFYAVMNGKIGYRLEFSLRIY